MKNEIKTHETIKSNRKTTRGRNIYFQRVNKFIRDKKGNVIEVIKTNKIIKHIQVSNRKLSVTPKMIELYDKMNQNNGTINPRTIRKKAEKNRSGRLLWDSKINGTYVRKLHGELS